MSKQEQSQKIADEAVTLADIERQKKRVDALIHASAVLNSTLQYHQVLERILVQIHHVIEHDASNVMLINGEKAHVFRGRGYEKFGTQSTLSSIQFKMEDVAIFQEMANTLEPTVIPDVLLNEDWVYSRPEHHWIRSYIGAPIHIRERVFGFLNVNSATPNFFSRQEADDLQAFANQAAIALENARLFNELQEELEQRKAAEEALRQNRDQLEEIVAARTVALRQEVIIRQKAEEQLRRNNAELLKRNEELDAFAHTVAHDLKNPVSQVFGYAELLSEYLAEGEMEEEQDLAQGIMRAGRRLEKIINELLLLAGVRKREIVLEPLDTAVILHEVTQRMEHFFHIHQATLHISDEWPSALGYGPWVEEVWVNYISNAVKYGGSPPRVEVGAEKQADGAVRFWVRDNGEGIPPAAQERLFIPFERLEQARAKGDGLGLSIVHRIMKKLNGQVTVESRLGEGSTFSFILPGVD